MMQSQNRRQSLKEMFLDYRLNRYREEVNTDWGSAFIYRPIGIALAWLLQATGITPNAITATGGVLLALIVAASIFCQPALALTITLSLAIVYLILDCTDGALARASGRTSVSGHYWDLVTDLAYRGCIYAAVGYLVDQIYPWPFPVSQMSSLLLAAWLATLARLARYNLARLAPLEEADDSAGNLTCGFTVYAFFSGMDTLFPLLFAAMLALDLLPYFVAWIIFYSLADVAVTAASAHRRLRSYKR